MTIFAIRFHMSRDKSIALSNIVYFTCLHTCLSLYVPVLQSFEIEESFSAITLKNWKLLFRCNNLFALLLFDFEQLQQNVASYPSVTGNSLAL